MRLIPVAAAALFVLAGCQAVPRVEAPPPPPQAAPPAPMPAPPPVQSSLSWEEAPVAAGDWRYTPGADSVAQFGVGRKAPLLTLRCASATRQIVIQRADSAAATSMTIRTTSGALQWPARESGGASGLSVTRPASDPGFDWIAFSRGRIAIETAGAPRLIVPAWAEITRVIEDCRN